MMKKLRQKMNEWKRITGFRKKFGDSEAVMVRAFSGYEKVEGEDGPYFFVTTPREETISYTPLVIGYGVNCSPDYLGPQTFRFEVDELQPGKDGMERRLKGIYYERTIANGIAYENTISLARKIAGKKNPICDVVQADIASQLQNAEKRGIIEDAHRVTLREKLSV